ncbi:MAG: hypothetical protein KBH14_14310 [Vicinamibacteria bacterium]|nr:hypothetical protein [Vicinamibacteria bacterium]
MKAPWLTVTGKGAQGVCGTCGALFILAIVYDRPACPVCGTTGRDRQAETEAQVAALKDEVEHLRAVMETWGVR